MKRNSIFILFCLAFLSQAYFYHLEKTNMRSFKIGYSFARTPCIKTALNGLKGYYTVDLGAAFNCEFNPSVCIDKLQATPQGESIFHNFEGKTTSSKKYLLKKADFLNLDIDNLIIHHLINTDPTLFEFQAYGIQYPFTPSHFIANKDIIGLLGHELLKLANFTLDFKNHRMHLFPHDVIPLFHFPYKHLLSPPILSFEFIQYVGYVITLKIDNFPKRFLIDTGASVSVIKPSSIPESLLQNIYQDIDLKHLALKNQKGSLLDLDSILILDNLNIVDADGILGMDFFHNKVLFFNNANKTLTIKSSY